MENPPRKKTVGPERTPVLSLEDRRAEYVRHTPDSVTRMADDIERDYSQIIQTLESLDDPARLQEYVADMRALLPYFGQMTGAVRNLEAHATFDTLTELPNRRSFGERLGREVSHAHRLEARGMPQQIHVLFIDIDHFKGINDNPRLGHDAGDLYLKTIAEHMQGVLSRDTDVVARLGGDEFAAILLDCDENVARKLAEELREAVQQSSDVAKREYEKKNGIVLSAEEANVTASIGLASFEGKDDTDEDIMKRADKAMYVAKKEGKNKVVLFSELPDGEDDSDGDGDDPTALKVVG